MSVLWLLLLCLFGGVRRVPWFTVIVCLLLVSLCYVLMRVVSLLSLLSVSWFVCCLLFFVRFMVCCGGCHFLFRVWFVFVCFMVAVCVRASFVCCAGCLFCGLFDVCVVGVLGCRFLSAFCYDVCCCCLPWLFYTWLFRLLCFLCVFFSLKMCWCLCLIVAVCVVCFVGFVCLLVWALFYVVSLCFVYCCLVVFGLLVCRLCVVFFVCVLICRCFDCCCFCVLRVLLFACVCCFACLFYV